MKKYSKRIKGVCVLLIGMLLCNLTLQIPIYATTPTTSKEVWAAYYKVLEQLTTYDTDEGKGLGYYNGELLIEPTWEDRNLRGLFFAKLIDFDQNGIEELMVMYFEANDYTYEIWGYDNNQAVQLVTMSDTTSYGLRSSRELSLLTNNNKTYLVDYESSYGLAGFSESSSYTIYTVENNQWLEIAKLEQRNKLSNEELDAYPAQGLEMPGAGTPENPIIYTLTEKGSTLEVLEDTYTNKLENYKKGKEVSLIGLALGGAGTAGIGQELSTMYKEMPLLYKQLYESTLPTYSYTNSVETLSEDALKQINTKIGAYLNMANWRQDYDIQTITQEELIELMFNFSIFKEQLDIVDTSKLDSNDLVSLQSFAGTSVPDDNTSMYYEYSRSESLANQILNNLFGITLVLDKPFSFNLGDETYPTTYSYEDGVLTKKYPDFAKGGSYPFPQVKKAYEVAQNILLVEVDDFRGYGLDYFIGKYYNTPQGDEKFNEAENLLKNDIYRNWTDEMKNELSADDKLYAILERVTTTNGDAYRILKLSHTPLEEQEVNLYVSNQNKEPNLIIDYAKVKNSNSAQAYISYIKEQLEIVKDTPLNNLDYRLLTSYFEYILKNTSQIQVEINKNKLMVTEDILTPSYTQIKDLQKQIQILLKDFNITLEKAIQTTLRIDLMGVTPSKPMQLHLGALALDTLQFDTIEFYIRDLGTSIALSRENLIELSNKYGEMTIELEKVIDGDKELYRVTFLDKNHEVLNQVETPLTLTVPAQSELATIFATYIGGSDNWGGQYNPDTKTLSFNTPYSGDYSVINQAIKIDDIAHLSDALKQAITFMVSKGYFDLIDTNFAPDEILTRYDFSKSLVKIFFALDRSLQTSFEDVSKDSPYYPFVASGQNKNIIKGFTESIFKGEANITKEQLIALCIRTLVDKKGYTYPETSEMYLTFVDQQSISEWARPEIALAVRVGLISESGLLLPRSEITRADAAEILYKLFMLLYEIQPTMDVVFDEVPIIESTNKSEIPLVLPLGIGGIGVAALVIGFYVVRRDKQK